MTETISTLYGIFTRGNFLFYKNMDYYKNCKKTVYINREHVDCIVTKFSYESLVITFNFGQNSESLVIDGPEETTSQVFDKIVDFMNKV